MNLEHKGYLIAILGSLLVRFTELGFQTYYFTDFSGIYFLLPWRLIFMVLVAIILPILIATAIMKFTRSENLNSFYFAFVPSIYYLMKEVYNGIVGALAFNLLGVLFDILFIAIPIGVAVYVLTEVKWCH